MAVYSVPSDLHSIKKMFQSSNLDSVWDSIKIDFNNFDNLAAQNLSKVFMFFSLAFRNPSSEIYNILKESLPYFDELFLEYTDKTPELPDILDLQAEYVRLFVSNKDGVPASPYASVYLSSEGLLYGDCLIKLKKLMSETGFELKEGYKELEDNIYIILEYLSLMLERLDAEKEKAIKGFLITSYLFLQPMCERFCENIINNTTLNFYKALAECLLKITKDLDEIIEDIFA